ncbi:TAXI family TRAP transporter solute-binding subunit [Caldinitratiruptor microaerophilus]|uniref:TAXI family TRAP transporter solute-binding subunit n=1 Tax=Caldinitratiruptor microaerophilus TaxID=671077 RepID=UPI00223139E3|nr:TAXI family TRAP transporter solute-binding subunit [Caldinitratiruptor microaerophilus]
MRWQPVAAVAAGALVVLGGLYARRPAQPASPPASLPPAVRIATATPAGVYYPLGQAMARVLEQRLGRRFVALATAGTPENVDLLARGEAEIAFGQSGIVYYAVNAAGPLSGRPRQTAVRGLTYLYPNVIHVLAREGSGVTRVADMAGRPLAPGPRDSATEINARELLEVYGLRYGEGGNTEALYLGYGESVEALARGKADAAVIAGGVPTPAVVDALSSGVARLIGLEEDRVRALIARHPWYAPYTIPAGTYPGQSEPVRTVAVSNILICRADLPDDLTYDVVRTLYAESDELARAHPAGRLQLTAALRGITGVVPLHPGAARFFREAGILQ